MRDDDDRLSDALESLTNRAHTAEADRDALRDEVEQLRNDRNEWMYAAQAARGHYEQSDARIVVLQAAVDAARRLHLPYPLYDECEHEDCAEAWEADNEVWVCGPVTRYVCTECRDEDGDALPHLCASARVLAAALGATTTQRRYVYCANGLHSIPEGATCPSCAGATTTQTSGEPTKHVPPRMDEHGVVHQCDCRSCAYQFGGASTEEPAPTPENREAPHHVEAISKDGYIFGWHCLTCNAMKTGIGGLSAAEQAGDEHARAAAGAVPEPTEEQQSRSRRCACPSCSNVTITDCTIDDFDDDPSVVRGRE